MFQILKFFLIVLENTYLEQITIFFLIFARNPFVLKYGTKDLFYVLHLRSKGLAFVINR